MNLSRTVSQLRGVTFAGDDSLRDRKNTEEIVSQLIVVSSAMLLFLSNSTVMIQTAVAGTNEFGGEVIWKEYRNLGANQ